MVYQHTKFNISSYSDSLTTALLWEAKYIFCVALLLQFHNQLKTESLFP